MRMDSDESVDRLSELQRGSLIARVGTTTRVFDDCRRPDGALIEAPSHLPSYPAEARNGFRVRPGRELALAIIAFDGLRRDVRPQLLPWLIDRAEKFSDDGLLRTEYSPTGEIVDGRIDLTGMALLHRAVSVNGENTLATLVQKRLSLGLNSQPGTADLRTRSVENAADNPLLSEFSRLPEFSWRDGEQSIWKRFFQIACEAELSRSRSSRRDFLEAIELADMDGHFSESTEMGSPTPYLLSHLCFLLAAHRTRELELIPKSGYTGMRRVQT